MRVSTVASRIGVILVTGALFVALTGGAAFAAGGSPNGAASQRPVFYEGKQVTVNMFEVPSSETLLDHNKSTNTIYASNDLDDEQDFLSVIDAIQGEGMNPLWHQVLIVFNPGSIPHQFESEDEVLAAAAGADPEITLVPTDEVYRCSIVGSK
jgi:ABC-type glycerol-3-phosphate transport system substrate-binding protein